MSSDEWQGPVGHPSEPGWYEVQAIDERFDGQGTVYRAWGNESWWIPLSDGWISQRRGFYRWRGPVAPVPGPAPDGTEPKDLGDIAG